MLNDVQDSLVHNPLQAGKKSARCLQKGIGQVQCETAWLVAPWLHSNNASMKTEYKMLNIVMKNLENRAVGSFAACEEAHKTTGGRFREL